MKLKSILLILFINLLGCESVDHQKINEGPAANNEPSWAPFAKENNMDWSKHYWTDREKNGNQGYLERHPYQRSEYKSPENSEQLETPPLSQKRQAPQSLEKESMTGKKIPVRQPAAKEKQNVKAPVKEKEVNETAVKEKPPQIQKTIVKEKQIPAVQKIIQSPKKAETTKIKIQEYIVKKGESLWKIAGLKETYGDSSKWQKIYDANRSKLKSPNHLYPGQILVIPRE